MNRASSWPWKLVLAGLAHAVGGTIGFLVADAISLPAQRLPVAVDSGRQWLLAVAGGIVIAIGLTALASGLPGSRAQRWSILALFAFVVNGVSIALETRIFTSLGGELALVLSTLFASVLCALVVVTLFPPPDGSDLQSRFTAYISAWRPVELGARLTAAWISFPLFYLMFGAAIAPIVNPWYSRLDFMHIPPFDAIIGTQLFRSFLFLLVSLPVVIGWSRTRPLLALALGVGHFTAVGFSGLIQTPIFPFEMAVAHTVEILGDSAAYGWALALLLFPVESLARNRSEPSHALVAGARGTRIIAAVLCLVAIGNWPYLYYYSVRWAVLIACALSAVVAFRLTKKGWCATYIAIAIVFNPIFPMPFPQSLWIAVDAIAGVVLIVSAIAINTIGDDGKPH